MLSRVFLYIFMTISHFNVYGWIGEDRREANRFNGVVIVSLLQVVLIDNLYIISTWTIGFLYPKTYFVHIAAIIVAIFANYHWLIVRGRGADYEQAFDLESKTYKYVIRIGALLLTAASIAGIIFLKPKLR